METKKTEPRFKVGDRVRLRRGLDPYHGSVPVRGEGTVVEAITRTADDPLYGVDFDEGDKVYGGWSIYESQLEAALYGNEEDA